MDVPGLIAQYGYYAVLAGAFLEGETILMLAGLAAHRGYLQFGTVVAVAAVAGFAGDQFCFFLGRACGARILARFPGAQAKARRFDEMLLRGQAPLIVMLRFLYGFRIVGPILLGMSRCPAWKFIVFNALGAALWAPLFAGAGWMFGQAAEAILEDVHRYELWLFAALAAAGVGGLVYRRLHRSREARPPR